MPNAKDDFKRLTEKAQKILIFTPVKSTPDHIASAFAIFHLLKKLGKKPAVFQSTALPEKLSFLEKPEKIISDLTGSRDFVIIFNTEKNKITGVKTKEEENCYKITITPEKGSISPKDFSFIPAEFKYDLIIIVGAESLEKLGEVYYENTDLFFEIPKININNSNANENYGQVNLIDITASSAAEIVAEIALEEYENIMDENIAQCLLTGIISATESFQKPTTTPAAMIISARLMKFQADQPTIIRYLYRTKSLSFLKLWGRVMARLSWDKQSALAWSLISQEDFIQSHSNEEDVPFILEEIGKNFSEGRIYAILYAEENSGVIAKLKFEDDKTANTVAKKYSLEPARNLSIRFENKNLLEAEKELLENIRKTLA